MRPERIRRDIEGPRTEIVDIRRDAKGTLIVAGFDGAIDQFCRRLHDCYYVDRNAAFKATGGGLLARVRPK